MAYRKISLNLSEEVYAELQRLSEQGAIPSVSEFIRRGIALQRYAIEASQRGDKLLVGEHDGTVRELVLLYG